ncbi:MAG: hypothetical protein AB7N76_33720 [Planctomycetota bacterium]
MIRARAPLLLLIDGALVPHGPDRVTLTLAPGPASEHRSRVRGLEHQLWVDPSLPPPADEGPLGPEASALRELPPAQALELEREGPWPPRPGLALAARAAALAALEAAAPAPAPSDPASDLAPDPALLALRAGEPWHLADGALAPLAPEQRRWLDARLLLARDRTLGRGASPRPRDPDPGAGLLAVPPAPREPERPGRSERDARQRAGLEAHGLAAAWLLDDGVWLLLAADGRRDELAAALPTIGLERQPLSLAEPARLELEGALHE